MTKDQITGLILESMREEVSQFVEEQGAITSSTEYEDKLRELSRKFAVGIVSHSVDKIPKSRNAKKES